MLLVIGIYLLFYSSARKKLDPLGLMLIFLLILKNGGRFYDPSMIFLLIATLISSFDYEFEEYNLNSKSLKNWYDNSKKYFVNMKQLFQSLSSGEISITNLPMPVCNSKDILIETRCSIISSGTERMLLEFGKGSLLDKAKQQPDKVKEVFEKVSTDGVLPTYKAIKNKLDEPLQLGYCNVGHVIKVGNKVKGIVPGDRVVSNGPRGEYVVFHKSLRQNSR